MFFQLCKARKRYLSLTETDEKMDTSAANPAFKDLRVHEFCAIATIYKMGKYVKWHNQSKMPLVVNERAGRPRSFTDCLRRRRCRLRGSSSASDVASRNTTGFIRGKVEMTNRGPTTCSVTPSQQALLSSEAFPCDARASRRHIAFQFNRIQKHLIPSSRLTIGWGRAQ